MTLVALGDSITANTLHNRGHMNWVSLLDVALAEKYGFGVCTVINAGMPGATYAGSLERIDRDVLRFKPDAVIIMLGMNDSGEGVKKISDFRRSVISAVEKIRSTCGSDIVLMTPNPIVLDTGMRWVDSMPPGEVWEGERPLHEYARAIAEVAADTNCALIDHYSHWKNEWYPADSLRDKNLAYQYSLWPRMANCTHPGPLGHRVFFRELAKLFQTGERFAWE